MIFRAISVFRKFKVYKWYWQCWKEGKRAGGNPAGDGLAFHPWRGVLMLRKPALIC